MYHHTAFLSAILVLLGSVWTNKDGVKVSLGCGSNAENLWQLVCYHSACYCGFFLLFPEDVSWVRQSFTVAQDTWPYTLLKECCHMRPRPLLNVVWVITSKCIGTAFGCNLCELVIRSACMEMLNARYRAQSVNIPTFSVQCMFALGKYIFPLKWMWLWSTNYIL